MTLTDLQALRDRAIDARRALDAAHDTEREARLDHQRALAEILGGRCEQWYVRADVAPGCSLAVVPAGRLYVANVGVRAASADSHSDDLPDAIEKAARGMVMPDDVQTAIRDLVARLRGAP